MTNIDREIDEELRQDRAMDFWRRYSGAVYGLAALIVLGAGGFRYYQWQGQQAAYAAGRQYQEALTLSQQGKSVESDQALGALSREAPQGYRLLARMRLAAQLGAQDREAGVKAYEELAGDDKIAASFRDVARLRAAYLRADVADRKELEQRLTPLAEVGQPFRVAARELLGLAALKADDFEAAGRLFDQIVSDPEAPPSAKQRADAFLAIVRSNRKS